MPPENASDATTSDLSNVRNQSLENKRDIDAHGKQLTVLETLVEQHDGRMTRNEADQRQISKTLADQLKEYKSDQQQISKTLADQLKEYKSDQQQISKTLADQLKEYKADQLRMLEQHANYHRKSQEDMKALMEQNERQHNARMQRYDEELQILRTTINEGLRDTRQTIENAKQELQATIQGNFKWTIGVILTGIFLIIAAITTALLNLPK